MRRTLSILVPALLLAGAFATLTPGRATVDRMLFPDETNLSDGLAKTTALVEDTASVAEAVSEGGLAFAPDEGRDALENADPAQATDLSNNYALSDHSNQARYPGYNDCDAWRNVFDDGWSASYALVAAAVHLDDDQHRLIPDSVREHWRRAGYRIETLPAPQPDARSPGYSVETEYGRIVIAFHPQKGVFSVRGTTNCLPPG